MTQQADRPCCPRCGGTLYSERDDYGWRQWCLQCGYSRDVVNRTMPINAARAENENRRRAIK